MRHLDTYTYPDPERAQPELRQIDFANDGSWSILGVRDNETKTPLFQRSGKKTWGVCVFGGGDVVVGAVVGFGGAGFGGGLLRWGDVPTAWAFSQEEFERYQRGDGCADGQLRASRTEGGDGLQHGVLPSR